MTAVDQAFRLEQRGIAHVPAAERWGRARDIGLMWAASSVQFEYLVYGAILKSAFGLDFAQTAALIVIGNCSYLLLALCSLQGPQAGTTAFTISRAPFGPNGTRMVALFNWATQVGFETEGLVLVVLAGLALLAKGGVHPTTPWKVALILLAAALQTVLPLLGHATVVKVLRALVGPFVVLYAVLAALTLGRAHLGGGHPGAGWQELTVGLAFTIALTGLGWAECGNDFSRYLPADVSRRSLTAWVFLGGAVPQAVIMFLGAAVATYAPSVADNPIGDFPHTFAAWFLVPFLVVVVVQLFSINSLDLYSSGVTLQAVGLRLERWQAVFVDTVVACGLTAYAVFSSSFATLLADFADLMIAWIAPWTAIFLLDWAMRRFRYVPEELQRTDRGGLYYRRGGVHWPGVVAQACGTVASVLAIDQQFFAGPISRAAGGADFSVFTGLFVGGAVYLVLGWRSVRRQLATAG